MVTRVKLNTGSSHFYDFLWGQIIPFFGVVSRERDETTTIALFGKGLLRAMSKKV